MRLYLRYALLILVFLPFTRVAYSQNRKTEDQKPVTVLVIPSYDIMSNGGISPLVAEMLRELLAGQPEIENVPFGATLQRTKWQMVYDKKYLSSILSVVKPDIILMSKLDVSEMTGLMSSISWNLSLRAYNTKTKEQKNLTLIYKKLTGDQIKSQLFEDRPTLISELLSVFNINNPSTGYDELTNSAGRKRFTVSDYNTDDQDTPNVRRPEKSSIVNPTFDTRLLFKIWAADLEGPHADFKWSEDSFFVVDYDGNGDMPYSIKENYVTIFYNDFVKKGIIKKVTTDSLVIRWEGTNTGTVYLNWK